jgi:hypothetical protein
MDFGNGNKSVNTLNFKMMDKINQPLEMENEKVD